MMKSTGKGWVFVSGDVLNVKVERTEPALGVVRVVWVLEAVNSPRPALRFNMHSGVFTFGLVCMYVCVYARGRACVYVGTSGFRGGAGGVRPPFALAVAAAPPLSTNPGSALVGVC